MRVCSLDNCDKKHHAKDYCRLHWQRWVREGDPLKGREPAKGFVGKDGHIIVYHKGKNRPQHRVLMEAHLGRALESDETVHHRNGVRTDNRMENLELRVGAHPQGLSPEEAVAWAREIIRRYAD